MKLQNLISVYGRKGKTASFHGWCTILHVHYYAHGSTLVEILGTPSNGASGLTDNVYAAETLLIAAEEAGWIERGMNPEPTKSQQCFGIGGLSGDHSGVRSPVEYGWAPTHHPDFLLFIQSENK